LDTTQHEVIDSSEPTPPLIHHVLSHIDRQALLFDSVSCRRRCAYDWISSRQGERVLDSVVAG
jgi:hypothetical protein